MIRSGVERKSRAASRRIVLRALVVGGFAGAAWLLSASAAQAADKPPAPDHAASPAAGVSVLTPLTSVLGTATAPVLDTTSALVGGATASADPATAVVPPGATAARSTTVVDPAPATSPNRLADRVADPVGVTTTLVGSARATGPAPRDAGAPAAAPAGPLQTLVAPLGLADVTSGLLAPVTRVVDPVLAPLTGVLRPVGAVLQIVVTPIDATLGTVNRTVSSVLPAPRHGVGAGPLSGPVSAVTPGAVGADADPTRTGGAPRASHTEDGSAVKKSTRHIAGTLERETAAPSVPSRPQPAPMRMNLGAGVGTPTSGSGSPTEGGAFGTVSSSVAGSMVAFHQLPVATDVAVLRLDAEDPTVSPD